NVLGYSETKTLNATIADAPRLVLETPDRVSVARGKNGKIKVVVTRLDEGKEPLVIEAQPAAGIAVEPATVSPGGATAELKITNSAEKPVRLMLVGRAGGKLLGYSHPITIDPTVKPPAEAATDEN